MVLLRAAMYLAFSPSARLLKARISIKSTFVTFVVAYTPTEDAAEGEKANYMAALNSTVEPVPAGSTSSF